jgi:predicted pyridoxine 5'-phosphate oxidase superfamily flavin-nucleotide-binding protein
MPSIFHDGEIAVQSRAGVRERVAAAGERMLRDSMPDPHRELFEKLPTLLVGSLDARRRPWASVLVGEPGFVRSPDERHLHVTARPGHGDPLAHHLAVGAPVGLLGLEPHTRRRNRMNGTVTAMDAAGFTVEVAQSFGNCPQYIQAREPRWRADPASFAAPREVQALDGGLNDAARALLRRADTLFIASASGRAAGHAGAEGVDVSHRGGRPGFVKADVDNAGRVVLTLPDFRGNNLYNTLGNLAVHPHAGVLVMDAGRGDMLQLTGRAEIVWDGAELASFAGALRLVRIVVAQGLWQPQALPLVWSPPEYAPQLAATGTWDDERTRHAAT